MRENRLTFTPPCVRGCNPEDDGTSRTIKEVIYKASCANYLNKKDWGATGAAYVYETIYDLTISKMYIWRIADIIFVWSRNESERLERSDMGYRNL